MKKCDTMELIHYIDEAHETASKNGFWDDPNPNYAEKVMLIVTELSEAIQEDRKFNDTEEEIADTFIRLFDLCGKYHHNIEDTIQKKMKVNKTRPYKHRRKY